MVLYSSEDQYVPGFVDKQAMVKRWETMYRDDRNPAAESAAGRNSVFEVLPHANHELADERFLSLLFFESSESHSI